MFGRPHRCDSPLHLPSLNGRMSCGPSGKSLLLPSTFSVSPSSAPLILNGGGGGGGAGMFCNTFASTGSKSSVAPGRAYQ